FPIATHVSIIDNHSLCLLIKSIRIGVSGFSCIKELKAWDWEGEIGVESETLSHRLTFLYALLFKIRTMAHESYIGHSIVKTPVNNLFLNNILYVSNASKSLISIHYLAKDNYLSGIYI
ncbi:hypothetical protein ACJX0J_008825, partial [Zea mays]